MKITPLDLRKQIFKKVMRGYDTVEVRTFLDLVAEEFERLLKENMSLSERVKSLDSHIEDYRKMEQALSDALLSAQRSLAESRENAQKEAELIIRGAKLESERIVQGAKQESQKLETRIEELERMKRESILSLKSLLSGQLELLSAFQSMEKTDRNLHEEREADR